MNVKEMNVPSVGPVRSFWFDSADEVMSAPLGSVVQRKWLSHLSNTRWMGCTLAEMQEWIQQGWPKGMQLINDLLRETQDIEVVPSTSTVRRRKRINSDQGDVVHMERVWNGELDTAWDRMVHFPRHGHTNRYVSLFVNMWTQSDISWQETIWRSVAALKIADALQRTGRNVRISTGMISRDVYYSYDYPTVHAMRIKDYNEPLNLESLALNCTAMYLRTMGWRMYHLGQRDPQPQMGYLLDEAISRKIWPHPIIEDELTTKAMLVRIDRCYRKSDLETIINDVQAQLLGQELETSVVGNW